MKYDLDFNGLNNKNELHKYLKEKLNFPDYYGANLDALYDLLTCFEDNTIIEITNFSYFKNADFKYSQMVLNTFLDVNNEQIGVNIVIKN